MIAEKLKTIIDNITITGFKNFGYDDIANVCHLMNTNDPLKWFQINLEINSLKDHTYLIIRAKINFTTVTKIINEALQIEYNEKSPFSWENADTITISEELFQKINSEEIRPILKHNSTEKHKITDQSIDNFYKQIQFVFDQYLQPFIDKYTDLQTVNDEIIEKKSSDEWCNFIPGETIFKSLVIMKICGNNKYTEFLNDYKSNIENAISNGNSRYVPYYNQLLQLIKYQMAQECN